MDKQSRFKDKQDTCRIGYVAFSRAKEFLCIACLEEIDDEIKKHLSSLKVVMVPAISRVNISNVEKGKQPV
ncbi:hypothetical protein Q75_02880 [Bacillus coahuilensis p1.1.43]|uniref:Uncharacterized protein n=1 Tax=Bacillus coahuilensis p1.1.43 TaxID=1150625 RepID=A0A147KBG4_9BACI|nr:hypothetical protein [Bacillus coahuilensis]KUP08425.1 hypothetical protein Q75_02880 [Bacillus coahuilensis p1.1.43]